MDIRPGIDEISKDAWARLADAEERAAWDRFYQYFDFRPSTDPAKWPGISEPEPSVTYSISHVYGHGAEPYTSLTTDLCTKLVSAFRKCVSEDEWIYALDWQHSGYRFWPHSYFPFKSEDHWPVPPLPDGDYYIFLGQSFEFGVFGHPWEQTMCIFGSPLMTAFEEARPELFTNATRRNGRLFN
jgi:hypothetical protein